MNDGADMDEREEGYPFKTKRGLVLMSVTKPGPDGQRRGGPKGTALLCEGERRQRRGWLCERMARDGRDFCKVHGGRNRTGPLHPNFTTGQHTRYMASLPARYRKAFVRAVTSADLADVRSELALIESRIVELGEDLSRSESGELWRRLSEARLEALAAAQDVRAAEQANDAKALLVARQRQQAAMVDVFGLIERGGRDQEVWREMMDAVERKRRLSETHTRKVVAERANISIDTIAAVLVDIGRVLRQNVDDPRVLNAVEDEFRKLLPSDADILAEVVDDDDDDDDTDGTE